MSVAENDSNNSKTTLSPPKRKRRTKSEAKQVDENGVSKLITPIQSVPTFPCILFEPSDAMEVMLSSNDNDYNKALSNWTIADIKELKESFKPNIEGLSAVFPNFKEAIDFYDGQAKLSEMAMRWYQARPILLLGDPGLGKTMFCKALAKELGMDFKVVSCGNITASWVLSGLCSSWRGAKPGVVSSFMKDCKSMNPIIMLDEIDKLSSAKDGDPYAALYSFLEQDTAKVFEDEFLNFPINLQYVNWIATANDLSRIPDAILSRFKIIKVDAPSKEHMRTIVGNAYSNLRVEHCLEHALGGITEAAIWYIADRCESPRKAVEMLLESFGNAAIMHKQPGPAIIDVMHCVTKSSSKKQKIGF